MRQSAAEGARQLAACPLAGSTYVLAMAYAIRFISILAWAVISGSPTLAGEDFQTEEVKVRAEIVASGLSHPWGLDFLPDGSAIVTERAGQMRIVKDGKLSAPVDGVPEVYAQGQGGLLDVVVDQGFESNGTIYFSYAQPGPGGAATAIARARLVVGAHPRLENIETIFSMQKKAATRLQFGSRIVQAPDGSLFATIGDQGQKDRAQDPGDAAGSIIHIEPDGSIPADNPAAPGWLPQIWSIGHRNPQSAAWDPLTNSLWTVEHGARGGDEVNRPRAGRNYGWPVISFGRNYDGSKIGVGTLQEGMEQPVHYWDPSIAPSGLAVYEGEMFPEWRGNLLVGALKFQLVSRLQRDAIGTIVKEERMFQKAFGRIRDVNVAPDGSVWLLTDEDDGQIVRLSRSER